jgi:hypothetical protein
MWDWALFVGGFVPALIFGVAFGNLFVGVPFGFDGDLRMHSTITLFSLLNPFALLAGWSRWRCWRCTAPPGSPQGRRRAGAGGRVAAIPYAAAAFVVCSPRRRVGFASRRLQDHQRYRGGRPSNPLLKTVARVAGGWWENYKTLHPLFWLAPLTAYLARCLRCGRAVRCWPGSLGAGAAGRDRHRGPVAVPVPAAVVEQSRHEPDGVGCLLEQADARRSCWAASSSSCRSSWPIPAGPIA